MVLSSISFMDLILSWWVVRLFFLGQSIVFGILAFTTRRFQCLWTPYVCIFAACAVADQDIWVALVEKLQSLATSKGVKIETKSEKRASSDNGKKQKDLPTKDFSSSDKNSPINSVVTSFLKHVIVVFVIICLLQTHKEDINKELEDLREFWDPDTVDLMEWINKDIPKEAAFTGSMQLLAGVRLCTWRPITNHPHFEDKDLRDRTREVAKYLFWNLPYYC